MINELPQNQLTKQVDDLESFMRGFKNKQITGGASLLFSLYEPPGEYQWSGKIDQPGQAVGTYNKIITYDYHAPHQEHVYADLITEFYIGNLNHEWNKQDDYYLKLFDGSGTSNYYDMNVFVSPLTVSQTKLARWKIVLTSNDNSTTCYLKFRVVTSDRE